MGRRRKNESDILVKIVDDFYADEANGNPDKLKYSRLAQYAQTHGVRALWYDFRRDKAVIRRIQELREQSELKEESECVPVYKTLDIEEMLRNCRTMEDLKEELRELDAYWKKTYEDTVRFMAERRKTTEEQRRHEREIQRLEREKAELAEAVKAANIQIGRLRKETVCLRRALRETLYPAIANELLREAGLPAEESDAVRPDAFSKLIEGKFPQPFEGTPETSRSTENRQERLLNAMRKQVGRNEE